MSEVKMSENKIKNKEQKIQCMKLNLKLYGQKYVDS